MLLNVKKPQHNSSLLAQISPKVKDCSASRAKSIQLKWTLAHVINNVEKYLAPAITISIIKQLFSQYSCKLFPGTRYSSWWDLWSGRMKWSEACLTICFMHLQKSWDASAELQTCFIEKATQACLKKKGIKEKTLPTVHQKEKGKGVTLSSQPGGGGKQTGGCGRTSGFGFSLL